MALLYELMNPFSKLTIQWDGTDCDILIEKTKSAATIATTTKPVPEVGSQTLGFSRIHWKAC